MKTGMKTATRSTYALLTTACLLAAIASPALAAPSIDGASSITQRVGVIDASPAGGWLEALLFYAVAGATALCAVGVAVSKSVVRMAVWLFGALAAVALLYFLLAASFLAAIQLIVYAGGTLVLLIFGVMLTNKSPWVRYNPTKVEFAAAGVVCTSLLAALTIALGRADWPTPAGIVPGVSVADIGEKLLTVYLVPFEVAGVLLMIVMVGAAHLARQED